jgi:hypothetical protein
MHAALLFCGESLPLNSGIDKHYSTLRGRDQSHLFGCFGSDAAVFENSVKLIRALSFFHNYPKRPLQDDGLTLRDF